MMMRELRKDKRKKLTKDKEMWRFYALGRNLWCIVQYIVIFKNDSLSNTKYIKIMHMHNMYRININAYCAKYI